MQPRPGTTSEPRHPATDRMPPGEATSGGAARVWSDKIGTSSIRAAQILLLLALAVVAVYALLQLTLVLIPVLTALLFSAALAPMVHLLHRRVPKSAAAALSMLAASAALAGVIAAVVYAFSTQWNTLTAKASQALDQLGRFAAGGPLPVTEQQLKQVRGTITDTVTSSLSLGTAVTGLSTVAGFVTGLLLMIVVLFFFLKDGRQIWRFFIRPLRPHRRARAQRIASSSLIIMGGYVRGVALIALVDALAIGLGLWLLGVPLALPLAVTVFIGAFIPVVGATVAGILAVLISLVTGGPGTAIIAAILIVVVQQLEGNLLYPLIMGQTVKLHPLVILLAITAGVLLAGIFGAIIAVPLTGVGWATIKQWKQPSDSGIPEPAP